MKAHENEGRRGSASIGHKTGKVGIFGQYDAGISEGGGDVLDVRGAPAGFCHPVDVVSVSPQLLNDAARNVLVSQDAHTLKPLES
jgi:hypothetical protein